MKIIVEGIKSKMSNTFLTMSGLDYTPVVGKESELIHTFK